MEKAPPPEHVENGLLDVQKSPDSTDGVLIEKRNKQLNRHLDLRVLPLCCWVYLLNFLDRGNIGNSKVLNEETGNSLLQQTKMTADNYGLTVTLFSLAYTIFEVPSNWVMKHYVRIVYFITIWYRFNERAVRVALVVAFCNLAGAFGGAIAYGVGHINGAAGLEGFRWLFIIEGIITILSALLLWFFLPDYPARAKWLSEADKQFAIDRLKERGGGYNRDHATKQEIIETFFNPRMLAHYFAYIADVVPQGSFKFFTPTIVTGLGYKSIHAQLLTVPPWVVGFFVAITLSYCADHFNACGWHISIGVLGWLTAGLLPHDAYVKHYGCLCLAACGAFPSGPAMTNWVTCNTPSLLTIPFAIALNNSCAGIGQIIAQWIWKAGEKEQGYPTGNFVCAACSFYFAVGAARLRLWYGRMNRRGTLDAPGEKRVWAY